MRNIQKIITYGFILISAHAFGQTAEKKNHLSIGGGRESYNGDLGNSWFEPAEEFYGFVSLNYIRYLNKSLDVMATFTHGDYGHCREEDEATYRADGSEVLNMLSRLTSSVFLLKYKFANGYLLKENARIDPYAYVGAGINNISNFWWSDKNRVNTGNYTSFNAGAGARYNFYKNFSFTYNFGVGIFSTDNIDRRIEGNNDKYMQHTIALGFNF